MPRTKSHTHTDYQYISFPKIFLQPGDVGHSASFLICCSIILHFPTKFKTNTNRSINIQLFYKPASVWCNVGHSGRNNIMSPFNCFISLQTIQKTLSLQSSSRRLHNSAEISWQFWRFPPNISALKFNV